jgi:glutamine amidotransferase-like uncharacterized protein
MKNPKVKAGAAVVLVVALTLTTLIFLPVATGMEGVQVAIYFDNGVSATSRIALENMFSWMHAEVDIIGSSEIREGSLSDYDILVMPGGCWCTERCEILGEEMDIILEFVANGGSYFGIGKGASYATNIRLGLFNGTFFADLISADTFLLELNVCQDSIGPDLSEEPESYSLLYDASGYYETDDPTGIIPIMTYPGTELPAMIAFTYGNGTTFLSSPHPEFEEGSDRDGTDVYDSLNDPDSEWDFMLKICRWLVENS